MTAVIENTPAASTTPAVEEKQVTGTISNKQAHGRAIKRMEALAPIAASTHVQAAQSKRDLFEAMMAVRVTITHEGRPDFGGNSGLWKASVSDKLDPVFEAAGLKTVETRRTFMNSVQQNGLRGLIMEKFIVDFVEKETTHKLGTPAFVKAVRAEYKAAKRTIPSNSTYFAKVDPPTEPTAPKVVAPADLLDAAITQLHTQEADYPIEVEIAAAHRMLTEVAAKMLAMTKGRKNTIPNRPTVRFNLSEVTALTEALLAIAESKATEETLKTIELSKWTPTQA